MTPAQEFIYYFIRKHEGAAAAFKYMLGVYKADPQPIEADYEPPFRRRHNV